MKTRLLKPFLVLALAAVVSLPGMAGGTVLHFDDIGNPSGRADLPSGHRGFTWTESPLVVTEAFFHHTGPSFPSVWDAARPSASTDSFFFDGACFDTIKRDQDNRHYGDTSFTNTGDFRGDLTGAQTINFTPPLDWQSCALPYPRGPLGDEVDKLVFTDSCPEMRHYRAGHFSIDHFPCDPDPVPLPPTVQLFGGGLLGLGLLRFRKRRPA